MPPKQNAAFVANMEDILEIYKRPYHSAIPVVCMDEQPTQLIKETRKKIPVEPGQPERVDYEYERNGTAVNFMFTEPLGGWRKVEVRQHKTSIDWAYELKELLDEDYPEAEKVILVCDNLNTHTIASLYETFQPKEARRLAERLEIHYYPVTIETVGIIVRDFGSGTASTFEGWEIAASAFGLLAMTRPTKPSVTGYYSPKHGSWLNVAEIELSVFTTQCLDRRLPDMATLQQEAKAWYRKRNANQKGVDWQFTTEDARVKLKRLYPQIQMV